MGLNFGAIAMGLSQSLEKAKDRNLKKKLADKQFDDQVRLLMKRRELDKGTERAREKKKIREAQKTLSMLVSPAVAKSIVATGSLATIEKAIEFASKAENPDEIFKIVGVGGEDQSGIVTEQQLDSANRVYADSQSGTVKLASPTEQKMFAGVTPTQVRMVPEKKKPPKYANYQAALVDLSKQMADYLDKPNTSKDDQKYKAFELKRNRYLTDMKNLPKKNNEKNRFNVSLFSREFNNLLKTNDSVSVTLDMEGQVLESIVGNSASVASAFTNTFDVFLNNYGDTAKLPNGEINQDFKSFAGSRAQMAQDYFNRAKADLTSSFNIVEVDSAATPRTLNELAETRYNGQPKVFKTSDGLVFLWDGYKFLKSPKAIYDTFLNTLNRPQ